MQELAILKHVLPLFVGWKLALLFTTFFGLGTFASVVPGKGYLSLPFQNPEYWARWAYWDGGHYRRIAENGYDVVQTVFFPAYPLLIRLLYQMGVPSLWAGLIVSHVSTVVLMWYLYKLARLEFGDNVAKRAVFVLLVFPTSFYFGAVYNESLFLAGTAASFYYARSNRWVLASIFAGVSSTTRLVGLAVIAGIYVEYLLKDRGSFELSSLWRTAIRRLLIFTFVAAIVLNGPQTLFDGNQPSPDSPLELLSEIAPWALVAVAAAAFVEYLVRNLVFQRVRTRQFVYLVLSPLPFISYLAYQWIQFGSPLSFVFREAHWDKSISFPWKGPLDYFVLLASRNFVQIGDTTRMLLQFVLFVVLVGGLLFSIYRFRGSYTVYYLFALLIPLLSGTLLDLPRYTLAIFPFFFMLALVRNDVLEKAWVIFSILMLSALSMLYINGYWFM